MPKDLLPDLPNVQRKPQDLLPNVQNVGTQVPAQQQVASLQFPAGPTTGRGILRDVAQSPIVNLLAGAASGEAEAVGRGLRTVLRDIPTQTTRNLAEDIAQRQAATRKAFVTPNIVGKVGEFAGALTPFIAAGPLAPEALLEEGIVPLLSRLGLSGLAGASQAPRHQLAGALLGTAAGIGGEAIPLALQAAKTGLKKLATTSVGKSVINEVSKVMGDLRHGITGDNMNNEVFARQRKLYEEIKGTKLTDKGREEVLSNADYTIRNPGDSVHNLYATAARLGDENITSYNPSAWKKGLQDERKKNTADLERSPSDEDALQVQGELQKLSTDRLSSFDDARKLRIQIGRRSSKGTATNFRDGNPALVGIGRPLKEALDKSLVESASDSPETLNALQKANDTFRNEQLPYENLGDGRSPFIKILRGGDTTDKLISGYVRSKQPERLRQFLNQLPDQESRDLVAVHQFTKHEKNPRAFLDAYGKLQDEEKGLLFPNHKARLDQLEDFSRVNRNSVPTKVEGEGLLRGTIKGVTGAGLTGLAAERLAAGSPLQAAALVSPLLLKAAITGAARNPAIRERLFQSLLTQGSRSPERISLLRSLLPGVALTQTVTQTGGQQNG